MSRVSAAGTRAVGVARGRLVDAAFAAGWAGAPRLPPGVLARGADAAAAVLHRRDGPGVRRLRANLARVCPDAPDLDALVAAGVRSYARYWRETLTLAATAPREVIERTEVAAWENFDRARARGRGVISVLSHSGNWDAAAVVFRDHIGEPFTAVAERLEPAALYGRFVDYRQRLGMEVLALTGGTRPVATVLAERLRAGGCITLLADRDLTRGRIEVEFFGATATMPPGPALLAATTGAALVPMNASYSPAGWRMRFEPEIEVAAPGRLRARVATATQEMASAFQAGIAEHPEDWHMLQPFWLADRAGSDGLGDAT